MKDDFIDSRQWDHKLEDAVIATYDDQSCDKSFFYRDYKEIAFPYVPMPNGRIFPVYRVHESITDTVGYHALECKNLISLYGYFAAEYYCLEQGVALPKLNEKALPYELNSFESNILRMQDSKWWAGRLTLKRRRDGELGRIKSHQVKEYCSDICLANDLLKRKAGKEYMASLEAISEFGEVISMEDVLKGSMSNPKNRRIELSVRVYGFVDYAQEQGHEVAFYTITAPSKYHANSKNYNGSSPRDTQQYLVTMWSQIRAELKRQGLQVYGFRFVEPHGDATPHWHLALFMKDEKERDAVTAVIKSYALDEDIEELKVKDYKYVTEIAAIETKVVALVSMFTPLGDRVRLFERDFNKLKAPTNEIISDIHALMGKFKQGDLISDLRGLLDSLDGFVSEVNWLVDNKTVINQHLFPLNNAKRHINNFTEEFYKIEQKIVKRFDKWKKVLDKKDPLTGQKKLKDKWKVRFDVEYIKDAGAIVAYVMKYISKNIDGEGVGEDEEIGGDASDTSKRVVAWASIWGIRQFQQVGGSSVGVYRELRRVSSFTDSVLEGARVVADTGNWKGYMVLQGGALMPMRQQVIKNYSDSFVDAFTGQIKESAYGEITKKVLGLSAMTSSLDRVTLTKDTQWKLAPKSVDDFLADNTISAQELMKPVVPMINNVVQSTEAVVFREQSESWLFVNNCTEVAIRAATSDVFASGGMVFDDDDRDLDDICLEDLLL